MKHVTAGRQISVLVLGLTLFAVSAGAAFPAEIKPDEALRKAFPRLTFESIGQTEMPGLYEVISGSNIYYFSPEKSYLFVGEIYQEGGKNLTAERKKEMSAQFMKNIPLDKAVKIGTGNKVVIEFTDPDCPFCKKASEFFEKRTDVTRYVFFAPLAHPAAIGKIHYILNASDKAKAYGEMMRGKGTAPPSGEYSENVKKLAQEHLALARKSGVQGTPTFYVNGTLVVGADTEQLEQLLKNYRETK